jgi:hypothetical protein
MQEIAIVELRLSAIVMEALELVLALQIKLLRKCIARIVQENVLVEQLLCAVVIKLDHAVMYLPPLQILEMDS